MNVTLRLHLQQKRILQITRYQLFKEHLAEADLGLLQHPRWEAVNYYYKALHLGCCSSPRSASAWEQNKF